MLKQTLIYNEVFYFLAKVAHVLNNRISKNMNLDCLDSGFNSLCPLRNN